MYAQLDDRFADHPNHAGLTDAAFRLHVAGILYSSRHLTDGLIPAGEIPRLVRRYRGNALVELVGAGRWRVVTGGELYQIKDYLDWNPSRQQVEERREATRKRVRAHRDVTP